MFQTLHARCRDLRDLGLKDSKTGQVTVDLESQTVVSPSGKRYTFSAPETLRQMLLQGVDEIQLTLGRRAEIQRFRSKDRVRRPWAY